MLGNQAVGRRLHEKCKFRQAITASSLRLQHQAASRMSYEYRTLERELLGQLSCLMGGACSNGLLVELAG